MKKPVRGTSRIRKPADSGKRRLPVVTRSGKAAGLKLTMGVAKSNRRPDGKPRRGPR